MNFPQRVECGQAATALGIALAVAAGCASGSEVTATRLAEERWERVEVSAIPPDPEPRPPAAEVLRFAPGTASLTPAVRAGLDRLASRLLVETAGCRVELRPSPGAPSVDSRLTRQRAAAARGYLTRRKGIDERRISTGRASAPSALSDGACVLTAVLG